MGGFSYGNRCVVCFYNHNSTEESLATKDKTGRLLNHLKFRLIKEVDSLKSLEKLGISFLDKY